VKKYVFTLVLPAVMLLTFTACSENDATATGTVQEINPTADNIQTYEPTETIHPDIYFTRHQFESLGFSVELPSFWEDKFGLYEFEVELDFGTRHFVEIYHIATREEMREESGFSYGGRIMTLGRSPREGYTYDDAPIMAGGTIFLSQIDGNTYFVNFPSGVEHSDNPETSSEFLEMVGHWEPNHWDFLINSFMLIDSVETS